LDLLEAKSRIAQALVESVFRRAQYHVSPFQSDHPLRFGREDFSPDLVVRAKGREDAPVEDASVDRLLVVKYRPHLDQFLGVESQRGDRSVFSMMRRQWPEVWVVLVTDRPDPGRSCFQALPADGHVPGAPICTRDLADVPEFGVFVQNVEDHESLVRSIIGML
jgi:hypothetical protein